MRGLAEHLSDLEASFFHDTDRFALPGLETWEDLDEDYQPQSFWARALGSRPRAQTPVPLPTPIALPMAAPAPIELGLDDDDEWQWQIAIARARAAAED